MTVILRAKTAEGFGGKDYYEETVHCDNETDKKAAMIAFAMSYGVGLDMIEVEVK